MAENLTENDETKEKKKAMKLEFSSNLIRHYLRHVYFINGHSCAGKSTMVRMLAERYDMIHCGENYHDAFPREKLDRWQQPGLCYFRICRRRKSTGRTRAFSP